MWEQRRLCSTVSHLFYCISPVSHLYLTCISPVLLYLTCSTVSHLYLTCSTVSHLYLTCSTVSHLFYCISPVLLYLTCSTVSHLFYCITGEGRLLRMVSLLAEDSSPYWWSPYWWWSALRPDMGIGLVSSVFTLFSSPCSINTLNNIMKTLNSTQSCISLLAIVLYTVCSIT